jgi:hypothetical protein
MVLHTQDDAHFIGQSQTGGQARRLDAEEVDQTGDAVDGRTLDDEVGVRGAG